MKDFFSGMKTTKESVKEGLENGSMTYREAGEILCERGYFTYIPSESEIRRYLNI